MGCLLVSLGNPLEAGSLANAGSFELGDFQASKEAIYFEEDTARTTLPLTNMAPERKSLQDKIDLPGPSHRCYVANIWQFPGPRPTLLSGN